jgi:ribosomal protein L19E
MTQRIFVHQRKNIFIEMTRLLQRLLRAVIHREERRLDLHKLWAGTTSPSVAFMFRVGPWMITHKGIHKEFRSVSHDGKISNRRWRTLYPKKARSSATKRKSNKAGRAPISSS